MQNALRYVVDKINNAPLLKVPDIPYYYLYVEEIWPAEFYDELLYNLPKIDVYRPLSKIYSSRFIYELAYGENPTMDKQLAKLNNIGQKKRTFWREFQQNFILNDTLAMVHMQKYKDYICQKNLEMPMSINCRLSKDVKSYSIGVHSDRRDKVFSSLFYLPPRSTSNEMAEHWGTDIMIPKVDLVHDAVHHPYNSDGTHDKFGLYKVALAHPGAMFSWCVTQQSYHGVSPLVHEGERDSIAFFVKTPRAKMKERILFGESGFGSE